MTSIKERLNSVGIELPTILIPKKEFDLKKWAVVACDQFTSEKSYWEDVRDYVGESPSCLNLIFPECYLEDPNPEKRIESINRMMTEYVENGIFQEYRDSFFLVKRDCIGKKPRWGLIVALDLECYSWDKDSKSLIRATEGTIMSRIPPRKAIRKDAPLELPHILVLINDSRRRIIEKLASDTERLEPVYSTELMKNGGDISAWAINKDQDLEMVTKGFEELYSELDPANKLLFAMGDGNHSFATAKSCWEDVKKNLSEEERKTSPARFCLVELENIFDEGLEFEAIHRVLFNTEIHKIILSVSKFCASYEIEKCKDLDCLINSINSGDGQRFGLCDDKEYIIVKVTEPKSAISAGTLQFVIDDLASQDIKVDYIHGIKVTEKIGREKGNVGVFLPEVSKNTFFDTIINDGALPRKTFSMGEAQEKRYYMEARKIK